MKASEVKPSKQFFGLFIGKSGSGKDCAAFSFPTPMKVFDFDLRSDGGALGTRDWLSNEHLSKIDITKIYPNKGFKEVDDEMVSILLQFKSLQRPYETIYFGSATSLSSLFLTEAGRIIKGLSYGGKQVKDKDGNTSTIGGVRLSGPADYKYLYAAFNDVMDYLKLYPINIIMSAHTTDRYGKEMKTIEKDGKFVEVEDTYGDNVPIGEKLTLTDKLSENIQIPFNEVYRFEKRMSDIVPKYYVRFRTDIAKTVHSKLPNGEIEITGKNFYQTWLKYIDVIPGIVSENIVSIKK